MNRIAALLFREKVILGVYILLSVIVWIQDCVRGPEKFNNFVIFRQSLFHLLAKTNLHQAYPSEYGDIFLYHPSFCIMFAPFSLLPLEVGLYFWLIFCAVLLFYAIKSLPLEYKYKVFFWWFILLELNTSVHNEQTNPVIAALGLFTFSLLEKGKVKWASLLPVIAFCIKGYGFIFAALFLFYPKRGPYIFYTFLWAILFAFLPLVFVGPDHFMQLYKDWYTCLVDDHRVNFGFSIMGLVKVWWPSLTDHNVTQIQYLGLLLFVATWLWTLVKSNFENQQNRFLLLAYVSLWVIMFNHAAESPTFVIAVQGVAIWYMISRESLGQWAKVLLICVFLFSILAPTDVYPAAWRRDFFRPNLIKVIPCLIVWFVLQIQLFSLEKK